MILGSQEDLEENYLYPKENTEQSSHRRQLTKNEVDFPFPSLSKRFKTKGFSPPSYILTCLILFLKKIRNILKVFQHDKEGDK